MAEWNDELEPPEGHRMFIYLFIFYFCYFKLTYLILMHVIVQARLKQHKWGGRRINLLISYKI